MGLFGKLFQKPTPPSSKPEHAVIVHLKLSDNQSGTKDERDRLFKLEDKLLAAFTDSRAGEYDGNEFGEGEFVFYMYGPNADALFSVAEPILRASELSKGGHVIKRYGKAGDPQAKETRIDF